MGFENKDFETILDEMKSQVEELDDIDTSEGTIIHDALAPSAFQFMQTYMYMQDTINNAYGDTANEEYLIRMAKERGIDRYPATNSIVIAEIPHVEDILGVQFKSEDGVLYTVEDTAKGENMYTLKCEVPGEVGNIINIFLQPIDNVVNFESCQIKQITIMGQDEEDLEVFRQRYLKSFRTHRFGGNKTDYIDKTMQIEGVGSCTVIPARLSPSGSINDITVYVRGENYTQASEELVAKVQEVLDPNQDGMGDGWCPIGHRCFVKASEKVDLGLRLKVRTRNQSVDRDSMRQDCMKVIQEWLKEKFKNVYAEVKYIYDSDIVKVLKNNIDEINDVDVEFSTTYESDYPYNDLIRIAENKYPVCETMYLSLITTQTGW